MNVDHLKAFQKVAATGSFTKSARELFLTQSAVSQQIRALEDEIGGKLFDRSGRKLRLAAKGEALLAYSERLFDLHDEIETLFGRLKTLKKGKISAEIRGKPDPLFLDMGGSDPYTPPLPQASPRQMGMR
ncbi:MAG: LysR family transcriptional regulator [Proteobacteria bacterium]|nr:LysR family transcriptional regulator [Pseudomonadota bacterium]